MKAGGLLCRRECPRWHARPQVVGIVVGVGDRACTRLGVRCGWHRYLFLSGTEFSVYYGLRRKELTGFSLALGAGLQTPTSA